PSDWPRDRPMGTSHRQHAVGKRGRVEEDRDHGRFARPRIEVGFGVPGGCGRLTENFWAEKNTGWSPRRCPILKCRPGSPQHLRRPAVNHRPTHFLMASTMPVYFLRFFASCTFYAGQQCGKDYTAVRETFGPCRST